MIPAWLSRQGWTIWHPVVAVVLLAAGAWLTRDAWADILLIAVNDPEASHILLVPVVAAWIVWVRRGRLRRCPPYGNWIGPLVAAVGAAMYLVGFNGDIESFWHAGAVILAIGCLVTAFGKHILFRFAPAFIVLAFVVPVPGFVRQGISIPLQAWGAAATHAILETLGFASERSGNLVRIGGMDVAVAEACNGMRMVFGLFLVVYAFAFGMPLRNSVRVLILLASPLAALICNVIRLVPTVLAYTAMEKGSADQFHDISGWVMLPIAFVMLLGVIKALRWALVPVGRFNLAYQ